VIKYDKHFFSLSRISELNHNNISPSLILLFQPVHIEGDLLEQWRGVMVNGTLIPTDGAKQTIATFLSCFAAFNLVHPCQYESLLEVFEYCLGLRKRLTKKSAKTIISTFYKT
jgi:hypothetical protein